MYDEGQSIVKAIESKQESKIIAVIADEHRTNQKCFSTWAMDSPSRSKPWLSKNSDIFLLFDYVHVVKCLQNNWLIEKTKRLQYLFNGVTQVAKWSDLVELEEAKSNSLLKLSKLNDIVVSPFKPIEHQIVSIFLRISCDETIAALESHPKINNEAASGTVNFLKIVLKLWKILM